MGVSIYRPKLTSVNTEQVLDALEKQGLKIVNIAAHTHETKRQTGNQENAYAYGVYQGETLKRYGFPRVWPADEPAKVGNKDYWGRNEALKFLHDYHPTIGGFTLVIVNAMAYSSWQEEGHTPRGIQYRIISQTRGSLIQSATEIANELGLKDKKGFSAWAWERDPSDNLIIM